MLNTIKGRWNESTRVAKAWFVAGLTVLIVGMLGGSYWILRDDYQVLFSDLSSQDAGAMVSELERLKIPYRLDDNGATVLVDREMVHKTRLKLMSKGFNLHGGVGLEIFNNADFGMTEFVQKVNYQRAMQGELARTIGAFDEVKSARVHLVLPESGLFKRSTAKPKASISLTMKDNAQLGPEQIAGIQRLVAASVPEIVPANVTVVDQRGVVLSGSGGDGDGDESSSGRLDAKKSIETYLTRKVVGVLDRAIGPGKAIVSVDAVIDYNQIKVTKEDIVPLPNTSGQNVGAVTRRRESSQGSDSLGDPISVGLQGAQGKGATATSPVTASVETEFAAGRRVENIVSAPGNLHRLSVGVLVPGISDPVELAKLKEIVTMAVGVDAARGDAIAVYNVAPPSVAEDRGPDTAPAPGDESVGRHEADSPLSAVALIAVLVGLILFAFLARRQRPVGNGAASAERLSPMERENMLKEIAQWAASQKS